METINEKISKFNENVNVLTGELAYDYPNLSDYEILKLSISMVKNVMLDNIYESLNNIAINAECRSSELVDINHNLTEIDRSFDFLIKSINDK